MEEKRKEVRESHGSSIWPFILIGIGVIWLLGEAKIISAANLSVLWRLWPVILIAIGVELLVGRGSRFLSTLIAGLTVVVVIVLMIIGPAIGLARTAEVKTAGYSEPLDGATSLEVHIDASMGNVKLDPLDDPNALMQADITYTGALDHGVAGKAQRVVKLINNGDNGFSGFDFFNALIQDKELDWNVSLNPNVPLALDTGTGTGSTTLNLADFTLTSLNVHTGTGSVTVTLPSAGETFDGYVSTGTGSLTLTIPEGGAVKLTVNAGTGSTNIDVPDDAAVQIVASTGVGSVNVANFLTRTTPQSQGIGQNGTWQSANFDGAEHQIIITYSGGTGSLNVH